MIKLEVSTPHTTIITKTVKDGKSSGLIYVPKQYIGSTAIILIEGEEPDASNESPV